MKKLILLVFALVPTFLFGQEVEPEAVKSFLDILLDNLVIVIPAVIGLIEVIVRLTPSEKDNSIFEVIKKIIGFILPNLKKGGGSH